MKQNKILTRIKSGEVKMKPKWEFTAVKIIERLLWLAFIGTTVVGVATIFYFIGIYNPVDLAEFGDLGWQIFYEDFPYIWGTVSLLCLIGGSIVFLKTGNNYKRSWQKNMAMTGAVILALTILGLFLRH